MLTILGSLLGFFTSVVPDLLKIFQDKRDKKHELELLKFQAVNAAELHKYEMQMQNIANAQSVELANIKFAEAADNNIKDIRNDLVQALNAVVRPIIALGFFGLYCVLKFLAYYAIADHAPFNMVYATLWTEEDSAIFAGIISFYYGNRTFNKNRK